MGRQSSFVGDDISYRKTIKTRINKYELNSPQYGSKDNPVPVLDFDYKIAHFQNDKNSKYYEYAFSRPAYYKRAVELYLTYMMSKEEFKERFEKEQFSGPITTTIIRYEKEWYGLVYRCRACCNVVGNW